MRTRSLHFPTPLPVQPALLLVRIILVCMLMLFSFCSRAQPEPFNQKVVDSVNALLPSLSDGKDKVRCLIVLSGMFTSVDSKRGLSYAEQAIALSRKVNFIDGLISGLSHAAFINAVSSEWPRSINQLKEAMQYMKEDDERMLFVYNVMFINYGTQDELEQSLFWARKALNHPYFYKLDEGYRWPTYMQMGIVFQAMNQSDSLKKYVRLLEDLVRKYGDVSPDLASNSYTLFAASALKEGRYIEALNNYRSAQNYNGMAEVFGRTGHEDSAIYYGKLGLKKAQSIQAEGEIQKAAQLLANHFETTSPALANQYLKIYTASKDKQLNVQKLRQLEQIRLDEQRNEFETERKLTSQRNRLFFFTLITVLVITVAFLLLLFRNNRQKHRTNQALAKTLEDLKSTQAQLVQAEKMASLGELTAGIAHEIQNPLNFVNNFSDVSTELIDELKGQLASDRYRHDDRQQALELADDIKQNLGKIAHHGRRADAIVKGMLQHSRTSSGQKEPTDVNALVEEYLKLAYHGLRAKDKGFNATLNTNFDNNVGKINIIPQDIGRVILNMVNNAFYALSEKLKTAGDAYEPTVIVSTKKRDGSIEISVKDNGNGIPDSLKEKIFQPFFTTKPAGQGTGLGLSLAYDIVTKGHGGQLKMTTMEGEGAQFVIEIPLRS